MECIQPYPSEQDASELQRQSSLQSRGPCDDDETPRAEILPLVELKTEESVVSSCQWQITLKNEPLQNTPSTNNKSEDSGHNGDGGHNEEYVAVMPEIMPDEQPLKSRRDISQPRTRKTPRTNSQDREQPLKKDRSHTPHQRTRDRPKTTKPQAHSFVSAQPNDEFNPLQYLDEERARQE